MARWLVLPLVGLTSLGCNLSVGPRDGEFHGIYVTAFEASSFRPCGWHTYWWLSGNLKPIFDIMPPVGPPSYSRAAYVRVRGTRSGPGQYGHLGASRYELVVTEVVDASPDTLGKCG